jgi:phosphotransferase family enzyme
MAWSRTQASPGACSPSPPLRLEPPLRVEVPRARAGDDPPGARPADGRAAAGRPLHGGTANRGRVVRVGDTVCRPAAPCRAATHALLGHLAAAGFDGAPRVLAAGPVTETLTYIAGRAAVPPLSDDMLTDEALVSVAGLLGRYHRAAASFDPAGHAWPRPVPARYRGGLVSHNDVHPANVIFRAGRAVALIDFDLAGPGSPAWDLASAARHWSPLYDERDVGDSRQGQALRRFRLLLDAYGLPAAGRREVAEAILANHDWSSAIITDAARAGHPGFIDYWQRVAGPYRRARHWCEIHQPDLLAAAR